MTTDEHDGDDQRRGRDIDDEPTRDARGRWLPGYCPNAKGRPKKKAKEVVDESDLWAFGNAQIDVNVNGQKVKIDRRSALRNKRFECAMKGNVSMLRDLQKEFDTLDDRLATLRVNHHQLILEWFIDNPNRGKPDFKVPFEIELEMEILNNLLNHYFPLEYPLDRKSVIKRGDADDG